MSTSPFFPTAVEELRDRGPVLAIGATDGTLLSRVRRIVGFRSRQRRRLALAQAASRLWLLRRRVRDQRSQLAEPGES